MPATLTRNGRVITGVAHAIGGDLSVGGDVLQIRTACWYGREGMGRFVPRGEVRAF